MMQSNRRSMHSDAVSSSSASVSNLPTPPPPAPARPLDRSSVVDAVVDDIITYMQRKDKTNLKFICDSDLQRIIWLHSNRLFSFERWDRLQVDLVLEHCYQVLGILVYIGAFTQLKSIRDIFFQRGETTLSPTAITNDNLWIEGESRLSFLESPVLRNHFLDMQWVFKPYTFMEERPSCTLEVPSNARLPFIYQWKEIGTGAFGRVCAVIVAGRHYMNIAGQRYENKMDCALKQLKTSKDLLRELKQLEIIKESLIKHERVMMHYVSFIHGDTFNILLPRAKYGDLEQLLNEGYNLDDPTGQPLYPFSKIFGQFDWRKRKCIHDLLDQITNIVSAVKWLHSGDVLKLEIIHRDLKPDNILVTEDPTNDPEKKSTIGLWQLSDLGISVLKPYAPEPSESAQPDAGDPNPTTVTIGDYVNLIENKSTLTNNRTLGGVRTNRASRTYFHRPAGTYTAPEVEHGSLGKESDVWSLACIFAEVIAFARRGRSGVREFEELRQRGRKNNYFYSQAPQSLLPAPSEIPDYMVRPAVSDWLTDLADEDGAWVKCCVKIILKTLVVQLNQRPKASELHKMLLHAKDHQNQDPAHTGPRCPLLKPTSTPMSSPPTQFPPSTPPLPPASNQNPQYRSHSHSPPMPPPKLQPQQPSQQSHLYHVESDPHPLPQSYHHRQYPLQAPFQPPLAQQRSKTGMRVLASPTPPPVQPPHDKGKDRRSSSGTSGNRSDVPSSLRTLQLNLSYPTEEQLQIFHFQKKRSQGKLQPAIDVSICPNGEYAVWLSKSRSKPRAGFEIDLTSLDPSLDGSRRGSAIDPQQYIPLDNTIPLPDGIDWVRVEYAYGYVVVQGKSFNKSEGSKYFRFYDLNYHPPRHIRTNTHGEMARVGLGNMAISALGFAVLRAHSKLLLFDLTADSCMPEVLELTEQRYKFSETAFSPSGNRLIAWCWGLKLNDALHMWTIDPVSRQIRPGFRYQITTNSSSQAPVMSVLPSPLENEDGSIDCIVRENVSRRGRYFIVRLNEWPEQELSRDYLTEEANGALAATIYKGTHLITLVRNATSKAGQVMSYPLHVSSQARRKLEPTRLGPFSAATGRKMRIVSYPGGLSVVTLGLDTQYTRTWFRES